MAVRGVLGEPYCSESCKEAGGRTIFQAISQEWSGICGVCRKPVTAGMGPGDPSVVAYNEQPFYFCAGCVSTVKSHVRKSPTCVICGDPIEERTPEQIRIQQEEEERTKQATEWAAAGRCGTCGIHLTFWERFLIGKACKRHW